MAGWAAGVFTRARNWVTDKAGAINPQAALFDQEDDNFAGGLNNCVTKDGLNKPSATMDWNNQRLSTLGAATARTDAIQTAQVQDGAPLALASVSGTDTITGSLTPAITAYANLMRVSFVPAATNTGAATLNVNSVTARAIVDERGTALVAGAIVSGVPASVIYDLANTRWVLQTSARVADAQLSANVPLLNAANTFTGNPQSISHATDPYLQISRAGSNSLLEMPSSAVFRMYAASGTGIDLVVNAGTVAQSISSTGNFDFKAGTVTTNNASASEVGYKGAPARNVTATGNTAASDQGGTIRFTSGSGQTFTLDGDPPTDAVVLLDNASGNSWTIAASGTLTWAATGGTGSRTIANGGLAVALHSGSGNWKINGGGLS